MLQIKKNIYWVGIKNWEMRVFHGHEYSTHRGSSFNSYLIRDKKTVLVDAVWDPFADEFVEQLEKEVGLQNIDMVIINHVETDHSGALGKILEKRPDIPVYCTKNGADALTRHFHRDINFNIVKTGDKVSTGEYELVFVDMQMLHWPDSMLTYVNGAKLVLSNDAFGQHYAAVGMFNDEVDACELYQEAIKYYANILCPFNALVKRKIDQIRSMNLEIDMIAPSHGVIWRDNCMQIVDKYYEWSQDYQENFVAVIYDTMYETTKRIAEHIATGLGNEGVRYKIFNAALNDKTDLLTEIFKAKGVIIGSPTVNNIPLSAIVTIVEEMKALKMKGKYCAAFGSYGWSGESPKIITQRMTEAGLKVLQEPLSIRYRPSGEELQKCIEFGASFAKQMNG